MSGPLARPVLDRIAAKVAYDGTCLLWLGARDRKGYGRVGVGSMRDGTRGTTAVHRAVYAAVIGPIPDGHEVDHVAARGCVNRHCCLPEHLEAVTPRENVLRAEASAAAINAAKTHCPAGHPYDEANTIHRRGYRECRACTRKG